MARRYRSNPKEFQWRRSVGLNSDGETAYQVVDLFQQTINAFPGAGARDACTVVAVKGYVRALNTDTAWHRGRIGIRPCDRADIETPDPANGPGDTLGTDEQSAWLHWMFYGPFIAQGGGNVANDCTWNHAASPWALDVQSKRVIRGLNQTLGLFISVDDPIIQWQWDLSVGVLLS